MARKKSRRRKQEASSQITAEKKRNPAPSGTNGTTAITADAPSPKATAITTTAGRGGPDGHRVRDRIKKSASQSDMASKFANIAKALGSLKLAVILLSLFTITVYIGIRVESSYNTAIAQDLVYKSWWFNGLLLMLAVTVFFAAAKKMQFAKEPLQLPGVNDRNIWTSLNSRRQQLCAAMSHYWPWKRHQFGFLVTHVGLLTMLGGGLLNYFYGVDAMIALIDTSDPQVLATAQDKYGTSVAQSGSVCAYSGIFEIRLKDHSPDAGKQTVKADISPGALPWKSLPKDPEAQPSTFIRTLNFLHQPFRQSWSLSHSGGTWLEVDDYIPLAESAPFIRLEKGGMPAFKLQLRSSKFPQPMNTWFAPHGKHRVLGGGRQNMMPIVVSLIGQDTPMNLLTEEFLQPPTPQQLGEKGVLVLHYRGKRIGLPVAEKLNQKVTIPNSRLQVRIVKYSEEELKEAGIGQSLHVEVYRDRIKLATYVMFAGVTDRVLSMGKREVLSAVDLAARDQPMLWFHPPDVRGKNDRLKGVLQFTLATNGKLYYRSFAHRNGQFVVDKKGPVDLVDHQKYDIWGKMGWSFRIVEYYPHAKEQTTYTPVGIAIGKETDEDKSAYPTVIHCKLHVANQSPREFWMRRGMSKTLTVGEKRFTVVFAEKTMDLGFKVKLDRAEQTNDPGTQQPASYASWVRIFDPKNNVNGRREHITMNVPLDYGGYMFYQSQLQQMMVRDARGMQVPLENARGKPVNLSGFTVARDPGLVFKYTGTVLLGVGIFLMFYMRAYFFKPKRRSPQPSS